MSRHFITNDGTGTGQWPHTPDFAFRQGIALKGYGAALEAIFAVLTESQQDRVVIALGFTLGQEDGNGPARGQEAPGSDERRQADATGAAWALGRVWSVIHRPSLATARWAEVGLRLIEERLRILVQLERNILDAHEAGAEEGADPLQVLAILSREHLAAQHVQPQSPLDLVESDGTSRRFIWEAGDPSVGIQAGYVSDDNAWEERFVAGLDHKPREREGFILVPRDLSIHEDLCYELGSPMGAQSPEQCGRVFPVWAALVKWADRRIKAEDKKEKSHGN